MEDTFVVFWRPTSLVILVCLHWLIFECFPFYASCMWMLSSDVTWLIILLRTWMLHGQCTLVYLHIIYFKYIILFVILVYVLFLQYTKASWSQSVCLHCGKHLAGRCELQRHINSVHLRLRSVCELCKKSFSCPTALRRHIRTIHEDTVTQPYDTVITTLHNWLSNN